MLQSDGAANGSATGAAQHFAALFPPLVARGPSDLERELTARDGAVDIDTSSIALPALDQEIESNVHAALVRWNARDHAKHESTMTYMQRLEKYRAIVRWILYENEDDVDGEEEADAGGGVAATSSNGRGNTSERRRAKERKRRRHEIAKYKEIFAPMPSIQLLLEQRRASPRVEAFVDQFPIKKRQLMQKRSLADTQTSLCFEFARRPPQITEPQGNSNFAVEGEEDTETNGNDGDPAEPQQQQQQPTMTTAATWRTRTLLASAQPQHPHTHTQVATAVAAAATAAAIAQELVLWIDVLHPTKDPARTQSFLVLGRQPLSELLDLVVCAYDQRLHAHARTSKLLFFDKTFYSDSRDASNVDYSTQILQWINAKPSRKAKYLGFSQANDSDDSVPAPGPEVPLAKPLERTTFAELALKMDVPGVYIHQGECEHLVRLRDARLLHSLDASPNQRQDDFPMRLPNTLYRQLRSCLVCSNFSAKFVCYGDKMATSDPMFFCEKCYKAAHYDHDGKLLYEDFQAFPFIQE